MHNILLIGGAGFIGSNLIKAFLKNPSYNIFVYEAPLGNISRVQEYKNRITILRGYLSDYDLLSTIIVDYKIKTIIHLVSTLIPGSTYNDYKREFESVIFPSVRLMSLCAEKQVKFIFFSSGGTIYGNNSHKKFKETDYPAPISYYGLTKQIIEDNILFENRRGNLSFLILRPSNPFGPGQFLHGEQGLIAVSIGKIMLNEPIIVWGDGSSIRDYIYIDDLSDAVLSLVDRNIENEIINIGSGFGHSVNSIILLLKNIAGENINIRYERGRPVDVSKMILDISKLKSFIKIKHTPLEVGMQAFFDYTNKLIKDNE